MSQLKVLVVEDQDVWQKIIQEQLQDHGCHVDIACDYQEASNRLYYAYDMVTLDMVLSTSEEKLTVAASSGWRLLVNKLTQKFPGTAVYVISASFGDEPRRAFELNREYGVRDLMIKDEFDPNILSKWVEEVQRFKRSGGRPDSTAEEVVSIYKERLSNLQRNRDLFEEAKQIPLQLAEARKNLQLIQEREAEFVTSTDIPLQLVKDKRALLDKIAELEQRLAALCASDSEAHIPEPSLEEIEKDIARTRAEIAKLSS